MTDDIIIDLGPLTIVILKDAAADRYSWSVMLKTEQPRSICIGSGTCYTYAGARLTAFDCAKQHANSVLSAIAYDIQWLKDVGAIND